MKNVLPHLMILVSGYLFMLIFPLNVSGQEKRSGFKDGWSVQANGGLSIYFGDIENFNFKKVNRNNNEYQFGYGLILQKQFSPVFSLRGQLYQGFLSGTKRKQSIWFEGDVIETSLSAKIDVFNLLLGRKDRLISLYVMGGIGWANWQAELKHLTTNEVLDNNGKDNTGSGLFGRTLEPVIPVGGGLDFRINDRWSANMELSLRPVNSDKLDAKVGEFEYDIYSYNFVGISYHFGLGKDKPLPPEPIEELAIEEEVIPEVVAIPEPEKIEEEIAVVPTEIKPVKTVEEKIISAEARAGLYDTPWPGVTFTVQIAASKTTDDPAFIQKKFGLSGDITVHIADGWNRFSTGKYIKYWQAREYRNILATRYEIEDAFVVAYKDGIRLTLSELLGESQVQATSSQQPAAVRPISKISFSVQILATRDGNIPARAIGELYEIDMPLYKELIDGWYQYVAGSFTSYAGAAKLRNKLRLRGVSGAFVIGYKDGERVADLKSILP